MTPFLDAAAVAVLIGLALLALSRLLRRKSPGCCSCPAKNIHAAPRIPKPKS